MSIEEPSATPTPTEDYISLYCPTEYEHYGIQMHYVANEKTSLEMMRMLIHQGYVYPGSYVAIDLEGKLVTSLDNTTDLPDIASIQLGVPIPGTQHSARVMYWDLHTMPKPMRHRCMNHLQAILDVADVTTLIHAGKNDVYALKHEYHYQLCPPIINTQVAYFEWMRLIQAILEVYPKCIDPPTLPSHLIPFSSYQEWLRTGIGKKDIGLNEVYQACGYPENPFKNQSSRSELKQVYYALNDVAFLCQSYVYMMKAWGELKIYQLKLLTHRKLIQTSTIPHPIIPILHHRVLKHLSNVLQKRGPMRIPELACHVLTYADSKTRQDFAAIPGGVRKLVQMYPAYFQGIASTFDDVKLKNSKVQLIHPVPEMSELGFEENGFDISEEDPWKSSERFKTFVEIAKHWDM